MEHQENLLKTEHLSSDGNALSLPKYRSSNVSARIVHIGIGRFHRSHQAWCMDGILSAGSHVWGIKGISLLEADNDLIQNLKQQDFLYTLTFRDQQETKTQVIGSLLDCVSWLKEPGKALTFLLDPDIRIISMTVTEKGYCLDNVSGKLDKNNPGIIHDINHPDRPLTLPGVLLKTIKLIKERNLSPPTFLSCDNMPENGNKLKETLKRLAGFADADLISFIDTLCFPNSMVDRITPAYNSTQKDYVKSEYGLKDMCPVIAEPFFQWIIEDKFSKGIPDWKSSDVHFVPNVLPYERMKIFMLNGTHSAFSYLSYLLGYHIVDEALKDPLVKNFANRYLDEIIPAVGNVPGINLEDYKKTLIHRFSNPAIQDQILRLTLDGSKKISNAVFPPLSILLDNKQEVKMVAFALAAWMRFLKGTDENGKGIPIEDPFAEELQKSACDSEESFLSIPGLFPPSIASNTSFVALLKQYTQNINQNGIRESLATLLS